MTNKRAFILFVGDALTLALSLYFTLFAGFGNVTRELTATHLLPFIGLYLLWLLILYIFNLYDLKSLRPTLHTLRIIGYAFLTCFTVGVLYFYLGPVADITPKTNLILNIIFFALLFTLWRRLAFNLFSSTTRNEHVVILGKTKESIRLAEEMERHPYRGYEFSGFTDHSITGERISILIFAESLPHKETLRKLYHNDVTVMSIIEAYEFFFQHIPISLIDDIWFLHNIRTRKNLLYRAITRAIDIVVALSALLIASPLAFFTALLIKFDGGGPIFYTQKRIGYANRPFTLYKFRSMSTDAEKNDEEWAQQADKRVTRVGSVIRKLHLDELPQMLNILKGNLTLVGPRPERPGFVARLEEEIPHYHLRHIIKPGFTGWAQIKHRYARSVDDSLRKFEYDLYYIKNRNLFLDLGIILKTIQIIFTHR